MSSIFIDGFPDDFPSQLFQTAWDLRPIGIHELAWPYPTVFQAIAALVERAYVILGGDVYRKTDDQLEMTLDNWYIEKEQVEGASDNWALYVQAGAAKAREYIENYQARHGTAFWYVLVVCDEAGYAQLKTRQADRP